MKKISLLIALVCASMLTFAGMAPSEYCGYEGNETKLNESYVTLTWETLANGNVQISIGSGTGATTCSYRNGGFEGGIDAFVVSTDNFENAIPASNYFTAEKVNSGNIFTLVKKEDVTIPDNAQIKHVGGGNQHALAWKVNGKDAYTYPDFVYTYGGVCAEPVLTKIILSAAANYAKLNEGVELTPVALDQFGIPMTAEITYEVSPADAGSIKDNVFTSVKLGAVAITAKSGELSGFISLYGVSSDNLAASKPSEASYNPTNQGELAGAANDGNDNSEWVTWEKPATTDEWWYVDLEAKYDLTAIEVTWGADYSTEYLLQVRTEAPEDADKANDNAWVTIDTIRSAAANSSVFTQFSEEGRYVRLHSLKKSNEQCIRLREVRVFGTEWAPKDDKEKPVMVKAELVSKGSNSVVISVDATDNDKVKKYHVTDAAKGVDVTTPAHDGNITIEGLTPETEYTFVITAIDAAGNESENSKTVTLKTNKVGSEYCAKVMSNGDTEAAFVWETNAQGAVVITILETLGGADEDTHFRGKGIGIEKFKVGETKEDAATYFEHACEGNQIILSLKDPANAPAVGTKIYVTNQIVEYATSKDGNAWPSLTFEYSYGRECTGDPEMKHMSLSADKYWCGIGDTIRLSAAAVDQLGKPMDIAISYEIAPADAGTLADGMYIPTQEGAATITAKAGDKSASITVSCIVSGDIASGKPSEAGYNPENPAELAGAANDGNDNSAWVTWENQPAEKEWWYVDLGGVFNLAGIEVLWGVDYSKEYVLQAREEAPEEADKANDDAWTVLDTVKNARSDAAMFTAVKAAARYVRIHSLSRSSAQCIRMREFRVFAYDKEKPVMVSAEVASKTTESVVLALAATDNFSIKGYHVVEASLAMDTTYAVNETGLTTIMGLKPGTGYTFVISAIDAANYESENTKTVEVTTEEEKQGIDKIQSDKGQGTKVIENGVLYLMYKGTKYDVNGKVKGESER